MIHTMGKRSEEQRQYYLIAGMGRKSIGGGFEHKRPCAVFQTMHHGLHVQYSVCYYCMGQSSKLQLSNVCVCIKQNGME